MTRLLAALAAAVLLPAASASASGWSAPQRVSPAMAGTIYDGAALAADGEDRVVAAWKACPWASPCGIFTATRSAGGAWSDAQLVHSDPYNGLDAPSVAVSPAGDAAIVFDSCVASSKCFVYLAQRPRGESAFGAATAVSPEQALYARPDVALTAEGDATVAYMRYAAHSVIAARTYAGGVAGPVRTLSVIPSDQAWDDQDPDVVIDGRDRAAVVWTRSKGGHSDLMSARLLDPDASTWSGEAYAGAGQTRTSREAHPSVVPGPDGELLVTYVDEVYDNMTSTTSADLRVVRRAADGTWGTPDVIHDFGTASPYGGFAAAASGAPGELVVALLGHRYIDGSDGARRPAGPVSVMRRDPATGAWSAPVEVGLTEDDGEPRVVVDGAGTATVGWPAVDADGNPVPGTGVVRVPRGGAPTGHEVIRRPGTEPTSAPALAAIPSGGAVLTWTQHDNRTGEGWIEASAFGAAAPSASFTSAPAAPVAGQDVTFTSTSSDPDGTIASQSWDLDDDGSFDDATGATAVAVFPAGQHTVELRVVDDSGRSAVASQVVTVAPAQAAVTAPPAPPAAPAAPAAPPAPRDPKAFVVTAQVDTEGRRKVPNVVGRDLAGAKARIVRSLLFADVRAVARRARASSLPKRPGGGRWELGDVIAQTPAARSTVTTATDAQAPVTLTWWAGAPNDRKRCDEARAEVRGDDLAAAEQQLKAAGCRVPDFEFQASRTAKEVEVKRADKDGDVRVAVPTDIAELDLRVWVGAGPVVETSPGPGAEDFSLTAGQKNAIGLIVHDRANRPMRGARVRFDLHEVGGRDLLRPTDAAGHAYGVVEPGRKGVIHAFVEWADRKGEKLYGYAAISVLDRSRTKQFTTLVGHTWVRSGDRFRFASKAPTAARVAGLGEFFAGLRDALLGFGGQVAAAAQAAGTEAQRLVRLATTFRVAPQQLYAGRPTSAGGRVGELTRTSSGVWVLQPNGVVSAGGANVVSAGGANVVAAGGANIIGSAAANVVAAGGANVVAAGGANALAVKGGFLLSDNGLGLRAGQGDIVRLPDGSRLLSDNGLGVVAAGGANLIGSAASN